MTYPYDEAKFQEHLAMLRHPKYKRDDAHQLRLDLRWDGDYPGDSTAIVELLSPWEGKEELLRNTAGVGSNTEQGPVKTKADLHKARDPQDVIRMVFIKPDDVKGDIAVFSLLTQLRYEYEAPEDGCEFVFDHNKVIFWGDGNMGQHLYDYADDFWGGTGCEFLQG